MASYTQVVKRYCGGDAIWTNKSNASNIISDDFFGIINASAAVSELNLTALLNVVQCKSGSSVTVGVIDSNLSVIDATANGSSAVLVSVIDSYFSLNTATVKGGAYNAVNTIDSTLLLNESTAKGGTTISASVLGSNLYVNNVFAKGGAFIQNNTLNSILTINPATATGGIISGAVVEVLQLNISLNQVVFLAEDGQYEILELKSKITNFQSWGSYTKVKLILKSQLR